MNCAERAVKTRMLKNVIQSKLSVAPKHRRHLDVMLVAQLL